ncbi:hypothetical protein [Collimonas fungivorans]|uniref:hypothetical protein n=1 Tax=Collimonas fungivorans TaxID=158899 RepID=UPI0026E98453|nr:hypothetical protein [Collimonas fungivorans]
MTSLSVKQTKHLRNGSQSSINQLDDYLSFNQIIDYTLIKMMIICISIAVLIACGLTLIAGCFLLVAIGSAGAKRAHQATIEPEPSLINIDSFRAKCIHKSITETV